MPKLAALTKTMADIVRLLEGAHVRAKPKETDRLQKSCGVFLILNVQSAALEQFQLGRNVDGGFTECPHDRKVPGIKNPHNLCLATDATRGMAGVLPQRLGRRLDLCKPLRGPMISGFIWKGMQVDCPSRVQKEGIVHAPSLTVSANLLPKICNVRAQRREWYRLTLRNSQGSAKSGKVSASRISSRW